MLYFQNKKEKSQEKKRKSGIKNSNNKKVLDQWKATKKSQQKASRISIILNIFNFFFCCLTNCYDFDKYYNTIRRHAYFFVFIFKLIFILQLYFYRYTTSNGMLIFGLIYNRLLLAAKMMATWNRWSR